MTLNKSNLAILPLTLAAAISFGSACSETETSTETFAGSTELRSAVLENLSNQLLLPSLEAFQDSASVLNDAVSNLDDLDERSLEPAQLAYKQAFRQWQQVALMQIGPLAIDASGSDTTSEGEGLGDAIYLPFEDQCGIDEGLVRNVPASEEDWAQAPEDIRSLSAIEYLLFGLGSENNCSSQSVINQEGSWDALGDDELEQRRLSFLKKVSARVQLLSEQLVERYAGEGFAKQISEAGRDSDVYASTQDAFNAWATALVAIDTETRDTKLGKPAGIAQCFTTCGVESDYEDLSLVAIRRNLESLDLQLFGGVRNTDNFTGNVEGFSNENNKSFDDILLELGEDSLVESLQAAIDQAYDSIDGVKGPLSDAIDNDALAVEKAHADLSAVVTLFKTDIVSLLNLELAETVSDTD